MKNKKSAVIVFLLMLSFKAHASEPVFNFEYKCDGNLKILTPDSKEDEDLSGEIKGNEGISIAKDLQDLKYTVSPVGDRLIAISTPETAVIAAEGSFVLYDGVTDEYRLNCQFKSTLVKD